MSDEKIFHFSFAKVYPCLIAKAERKGHTRQEVDLLTGWLFGYSTRQIDEMLLSDITYGDFLQNAPLLHPVWEQITGTICGIRVEAIEDPLMRQLRCLDKLVDELAKGKAIDKILRGSSTDETMRRMLLSAEIVSPGEVCIIGREGSTQEGSGFIQRLWTEANASFMQVAPLAKKHDDGSLAGIWGAMSDPSRSFLPWTDNFSNGLYLAGVECRPDADAPEGWTKWIIPAFQYVRIPKEGCCFADGLRYLADRRLTLAGAAHDFTVPVTQTGYTLYPIKRL